MQIKINTIITLSNNERFMVLNETMYEENKYFLVMGIDDQKEIISSKVAIVKEVIQNEEVFVEKIEDSELIIKLTNLFKSQLK